MGEAALCDRIALIQNGSILEVNTPTEIVKQYPKTLYNITADNMYKLIETLKNYQYQYSVYPFGEFVHYTDTRISFNTLELIQYLEAKQLTNIIIQITKPTIEDTFMELAR